MFVSLDLQLLLLLLLVNLSSHFHLQEFKRNQRLTNGGQDFPEHLLESVYHSVKEREFIMPDEHFGEVRENYKWKVGEERVEI